MLVRPIITEESMRDVAKNKYTFEVQLQYNKAEIAHEVARVFGVTVLDVATNIRPGKTKRVGKKRTTIRRADRKVALVTVKPGEKIKLFETTETPVPEKPAAVAKKPAKKK